MIWHMPRRSRTSSRDMVDNVGRRECWCWCWCWYWWHGASTFEVDFELPSGAM